MCGAHSDPLGPVELCLVELPGEQLVLARVRGLDQRLEQPGLDGLWVVGCRRISDGGAAGKQPGRTLGLPDSSARTGTTSDKPRTLRLSRIEGSERPDCRQTETRDLSRDLEGGTTMLC